MIFFEYFKHNLNKNIKVTLKNDLILSGMLVNVDHFLNMQLVDVKPEKKTPGIGKGHVCSVRGSSIKHISLEKNEQLENKIADATYLRFSLDKK